jgi:hypothetical protein
MRFGAASTTHAGIICAIFYMRIQHRNNGEHMVQGWMEDEDGERYIDWRDAWLDTLIQADAQAHQHQPRPGIRRKAENKPRLAALRRPQSG